MNIRCRNATSSAGVIVRSPFSQKSVTPRSNVADGERVSWIVGSLETGGRQFVFASRKRSTTGPLDTTAGADLAVRVLNTLGPSSGQR
jgi:hypothetical protein